MNRRASLDFPPKEAEHQHIWVTTPAWLFTSLLPLPPPATLLSDLLSARDWCYGSRCALFKCVRTVTRR
jgi:hypothetical protein